MSNVTHLDIPARMPPTATLTVRREDEDITVELMQVQGNWQPTLAMDENGKATTLTKDEAAAVVARALAGEDEAGY